MSQSSPVSSFRLHGEVAVLSIDYPPVNALGRDVRLALVDGLERAEADPACKALVIACAGRTFFPGADIAEFGKPPMLPLLPDVVNRIEACSKPVIAAIHGTALGGGLEVAMACHYRLAETSAKFGLPEVTLGLIPGSGGTQRLPRLIGLGRALEMMITADPIAAAAALDYGLIDRIVEAGTLGDNAVAFARELVAPGTAITRTSGRDIADAALAGDAFFDDFRARHAKQFRGFAAPAALLDTMRRSIGLPFADACAIERATFLALRDSPQSAALRYAFNAERRCAQVPGLVGEPDVLADCEHVAIIGAGTMGAGIAQAFLRRGWRVTLIEKEQAGLDRGLATIAKALDGDAAKGRLSEAQAAAIRARLKPSLEMGDVAVCGLVVEAAFETMDVKQAIFAQLDRLARPGTILATNTSYLDIDMIASCTSRPEWVLGLHFFSPANIMKLLEIVRGAKTSSAVLASAVALAKRIGKIPVVAGNCYGFIGNRMLAVRRRECDAMVLGGVSPYDIDRVAEAFGFAMGPYRVSDLAGIDLGWNPENSSGSTIREVLCENGRRGQKSGAGYYDYVNGKAQPSDQAMELIARFRGADRQTIAQVDDAAILERLLYPMINEGARILEEGIAQRASDIDAVWLHGYGWPRWTGGPMHFAEATGLGKIAEVLRNIADSDGPCDLLDHLARENQGFDTVLR
jgi:3-hydroxyacyl-CoA dehydrogenase